MFFRRSHPGKGLITPFSEGSQERATPLTVLQLLVLLLPHRTPVPVFLLCFRVQKLGVSKGKATGYLTLHCQSWKWRENSFSLGQMSSSASTHSKSSA